MTIKLLKIRCGIITKIALHCHWYSRFPRWMHCCQRPSKSGCELSPPAGNSGPMEVKISSWQQRPAQRVCESVENVLICRVYFCWVFFCILFVCIAVNCISEDSVLQRGFVVGGCDLWEGPSENAYSFASYSSTVMKEDCFFWIPFYQVLWSWFWFLYSLEMSLFGQKDKELRNLSIAGKYGKAQNCKKYIISIDSLSLQMRSSVFKEHDIFKVFGYMSSIPLLEGRIVPSCLAMSWFLALRATSIPVPKTPANGTINDLTKKSCRRIRPVKWEHEVELQYTGTAVPWLAVSSPPFLP